MSVLAITNANFQSEINEAKETVLLDFWAPWCGPCRMVSPLVDQIAEEHTEYRVGKINIDEEPGLAAKFGVMSIPTLVVMKNGQVKETAVGARPKAAILKLLED